MCGIWGFCGCDPTLTAGQKEKLIRRLFLLCESRGKEAAGIAVMTPAEMNIFRRATAASEMIKSTTYQDFLSAALAGGEGGWFAAAGHSRLVTNGSQFHPSNNQPVNKRSMTTVHNGIIVNAEDLWRQNPDLERAGEVDTEVFVELCLKYRAAHGLPEAMRLTYRDIYGMASTLNLFSDTAMLVAASNNGSLYMCPSHDQKSVVFASEWVILVNLIAKDATARRLFAPENISQVKAGEAFVFNLYNLQASPFLLRDACAAAPLDENAPRERPVHIDQEAAARPAVQVPEAFTGAKYADFEIDTDPIRKLRRCTKCVLPETMPFIEFDSEGVCNYCHTYKKEDYKGEEALRSWASGIVRTDGNADSVVAFSGGRDSSYGLHYFVKELGLHPVAYTYDWGMVTDLARRNQSRMCDRLGVELILVSADIAKKRRNIRKNVAAWLKKPDLGMVPLFMAGDKQYFYYANRVRKLYGLKDILLASNPFEKTHFKSGFCGVRPAILKNADGNMELEQLSVGEILRMAAHYAGQYATNPSYINASLADTIGATLSYYAIPHNYFRLFSYIPWEEDKVNGVLLEEYDWETSPDTDSTWRIGDGTAPWYNYIYYAVCGFSENDTLRSNQIREGMLSRERALELVYRDNAPRFESLQWYFDVIGIDMADALRVVKRMKTLY